MTIQEQALDRLKKCFERYTLLGISEILGLKHTSQVSKWKNGAAMSKNTAALIILKLTPSGRVRK